MNDHVFAEVTNDDTVDWEDTLQTFIECTFYLLHISISTFLNISITNAYINVYIQIN